MRINNTKAASNSPETSEIRSLIMNEFAQWHANDGALETAIPGVILYRFFAPTELAPIFLEPRISVALQGTKRIVLGEKEYVYDESQFRFIREEKIADNMNSHYLHKLHR